ncbi:hypothetical protein Poli38472_010319 [Pythium oligandrum]|uniref:Oxidoreductase n=1 Tax=Pythium oligandrum TaxID=41045 RepID=A0A8K1C3G0_PYTOL|nr:hypothetical protein Poli38472_010319 [Pythium oligandrum]|eukprot:TMW55437.1 hypothetical protein Poli38472_010319 [Pythium oligandrum]
MARFRLSALPWLRKSPVITQSRCFSTPSECLRVAIVGVGRMGQIRLRGLQQHPRIQIASIIDASLTGANAARYEAQYNAPCFLSLADAAALKDVHGVWIATPTPTHLPVIQDALTNSKTLKAIGIEKPVAGTLEEIDQAYNHCFQQNVHLVCSFQRRFDPSYEALRRQCVDEGRLGRLQSIHTVFRDHPCPSVEYLKTGGDPFHDLAVHDIDYVCTVVGEYPTRVYAYGTSLSDELKAVNVMDKASVWLEFPRTGVICTMDMSRRADYGYDQRVEVSGELGMLQVLNPPRTQIVHSGGHGVQGDTLVHSFPERFQDAYERELDHFVDVLDGKTMPRVHWNAARMATIIAEAARVAATQRKVITIKYVETCQDQPRQDPYLHVEYEY